MAERSEDTVEVTALASITVTATPVECTPPGKRTEIDVTWTDNHNAAWMAVDELLMGHGNPPPTKHVQSRTRTGGGRQQRLQDTTATSGNTYRYNVINWDGNLRQVASGQSNSALAGICSFLASTAFIQKYPGIFELLVPRGAFINDYTHEEGTILEGIWQHVHRIAPPNNDILAQVSSVNLVQSISGKLEAIARETLPGAPGGDFLAFHEFDPEIVDWDPLSGSLSTDDGPINNVTGSTAFIQSTYDQRAKFELLVPRGAVIDHYVLEQETILEGLWRHVHTLRAPADNVQITAVSLVQSSSGKLEAIARVSPAQGTDYLVAYEFTPALVSISEIVSVSEDASVYTSEDTEVVSVSESVSVSIAESVSDAQADWQGPVKLIADGVSIDRVTGSPAIIQSSRDLFELLVPRGTVIDHYTHATATVLEGQWSQIRTLTSPDNTTQIKANWLIQSTSGKFEAVARVSPAGGGDDYLVGYESDPGTEWQGPVKLVANDGPILAGEPMAVIR